MRRKVIKLRQFHCGGAKVNSTCIGMNYQSHFVVGDSQNNIRLYTFQSQKQVEVYSHNNNNGIQTQITAVALSYNEKETISGTNRGMINIWDMATAKSISSLRGHNTSVNCFGIFPDEPSRLASGSYDTTVKLWDIRRKQVSYTLKGHSKQINSVTISPDNIMLLSGSEDNTARLWDLRYPDKPIFISNQHNGPIIKVRFNPEDCMFATSSMDKTAKYFKCQQKSLCYISSTQMIATPITAIGFNQDGRFLFTAANDVLKSWNMKKGTIQETFAASWRGVQQIAMIKGALMGVSFYQNNLSLWVCDVNRKIKNTSSLYNQSTQNSFVLPPINNKLNKIQNDNKIIEINEIQNIVGMAVNKVNKIQDKPTKDYLNEKKNEQLQRKKQEMQRKKLQQQKRRREMQQQRQRLRLQRLQKQRKQKQRRQQQRLRRQEEQRIFQQKLYQERLIRQKQIQNQVQKTLEQNSPENQMEESLQADMLENSQFLRMSTYIQDPDKRERTQQMELIGEILQNQKYQTIMKERTNQLLPILNYWRKGEIIHSLQVAHRNKSPNILIDFTNAILYNNQLKSGITTEAAIQLSSILCKIMVQSGHGIYVVAAMKNINQIVLLFKEELIKIKTFNSMARVDLSREQRLAKYDKLIQQFLNIFKQERLKKYAKKKQQGSLEEISINAAELYKNLEQILIKIIPRSEPELA